MTPGEPLTRPAADSAVTVLPLPLSPTTPSVSPRATARLTPSTERTKARFERE
jgi:hypothetical protein